MPQYAVVIPTYNSAKTLVRLLKSLEAQTFGPLEVIVVDDASTDETSTVARGFPFRYERLPNNSGPAAARNQGVTLSESEWIVFTDADTEFQPETMAQIHQTLSTCDADALVGTYAGIPANEGFVPRYKAMWEYAIINLAHKPDARGLVTMNTWAPRPGVVRRRAIEAVGGFNTRFRGADLEDMDLGYRLSAAGYRIYFAPSVRIRHHYPATMKSELVPFARRAALWMRMMARRERKQMDSLGEGSLRQALAHISGFAAFGLLVLGLGLSKFFLLPFILCVAAFATLNGTFLRLAFQEEGPFFALKAASYGWLHSIVLGFAAAYGLATAFRGER